MTMDEMFIHIDNIVISFEDCFKYLAFQTDKQVTNTLKAVETRAEGRDRSTVDMKDNNTQAAHAIIKEED